MREFDTLRTGVPTGLKAMAPSQMAGFNCSEAPGPTPINPSLSGVFDMIEKDLSFLEERLGDLVQSISLALREPKTEKYECDVSSCPMGVSPVARRACELVAKIRQLADGVANVTRRVDL